MKARLTHPDRDFDPTQPWPGNEQALVQDLALDTLLGAMAGGDTLVHEVARRALLTACRADLETIRYRQAVLRDGLDHPAALRALYDLAIEAIESKRKHDFGVWGFYPATPRSPPARPPV